MSLRIWPINLDPQEWVFSYHLRYLGDSVFQILLFCFLLFPGSWKPSRWQSFIFFPYLPPFLTHPSSRLFQFVRSCVPSSLNSLLSGYLRCSSCSSYSKLTIFRDLPVHPPKTTANLFSYTNSLPLLFLFNGEVFETIVFPPFSSLFLFPVY